MKSYFSVKPVQSPDDMKNMQRNGISPEQNWQIFPARSFCHIQHLAALKASVTLLAGGGWVRQRCHVSCVTWASNWYWLTVGQGLLPLQQVWVEGECFNFFFVFTFIHFPPFPLSLSFISSTISSISLLPFSGRWHKMTHKGWCVVNPQHNQYIVSLPGLCPWRAYVVTQLLASVSVRLPIGIHVSTMFKFSKVCVAF